MAKAIIITGGNVGDVKDTLRRAQQEINRQLGIILRCSHSYESKAWGFTSSENFYNQAIILDTDFSPEELLDKVLEIETLLGRDREEEARIKAATGEPFAPRKIDIDILFYDDLVMDTPRLTIPHPLIQDRDFVLRPLNEITPDKVHPVLRKTIHTLFEEMEAKGEA
ncbi:MAG: 2-amino-4-hydroxy-6-hydroxymethyldihydropteridine diphosphokinase [Tidjanibacter sp.]|nr:2-amino-4-hydroxy-6-hydroxymethyldihydropteridine diphosphokinase [Tidjanibacter sp.]